GAPARGGPRSVLCRPLRPGSPHLGPAQPSPHCRRPRLRRARRPLLSPHGVRRRGQPPPAHTRRTDGPDEALAIARQICEALEYAHAEGVAPRDIKPENILLDKKGRVKMADFGLAKLLGPVPAEPQLTASHQIVGTLKYMAPEQLERPLEVDHRADLYSLGVVLYEMLTGELPFGRFVLPSEKGVGDSRLDAVILRALAREQARRLQSAAEMAAALASLSGGGTTGDPTQILAVKSPKEAASTGLRGLLHRIPVWGFLLCLLGAAACFEPFFPWAELQV